MEAWTVTENGAMTKFFIHHVTSTSIISLARPLYFSNTSSLESFLAGSNQIPGQQATESQILFRKLALKEPGDLWAVDRSDVAYKYHDGSWIPLPGEPIQVIQSGMLGVIAVHKNNSLYRRAGITPENPVGSSWEPLLTTSM